MKEKDLKKKLFQNKLKEEEIREVNKMRKEVRDLNVDPFLAHERSLTKRPHLKLFDPDPSFDDCEEMYDKATGKKIKTFEQKLGDIDL